MNFSFILKDYHTFKPLSNKDMQIINIDSKQIYTQTSNANGEAIFNISDDEKGDFFSITIIDDNYEANPYYLTNDDSRYDSKQTTQKILTPNNYQNHSATLYFKAYISLYFNGTNLFILQGDSTLQSYEAISNNIEQINNGDYFLKNHTDTKIAYKDRDFTQAYTTISQYYNDDNNNKATHNNILLSNFMRFESFLHHYKQSLIKLTITNDKQIVESISIYKHNKAVFADISKPFAAGTYITLEAIGKQVHNTKIYWETQIRYTLNGLQSQKILSHYLGAYITSFYLYSPQQITSLKQQGYTDFTYRIYASSTPFHTSQTPYIEFNLNFEVGEDISFKEAKRNKQSLKQQYLYNQTTTNNTESWNTLHRICTLNEALRFLQANVNAAKDYNDLLDYFKAYPQLAGKIAYIYYCFDVSNDEFITSIQNDNDEYEYIKDREEFVEGIMQIFIEANVCHYLSASKIRNNNKLNYKKIFQEAFLNRNQNIDTKLLVQSFVSDIGNALNIEERFMPKVEFDAFGGNAGAYDRHTNILSITLPSENTRFAFIDFMDTIIHELRHFYMYYVNEDATSHRLKNSKLARFIYFNLYFYISSQHQMLFDSYDKKCASFDAEIKQCIANETYLQNGTISPLYYIQPSERDCRVVAGQFRQKAGVK